MIVSHAAKVRCDEKVDTLTDCTLSVINSVEEIKAGVRCFQTNSEGM